MEGWKAIAGHLGRTVRTVQRWEHDLGLPIRRHLHNTLSSVYAYRLELDGWLAARVPDLFLGEGASANIPATGDERLLTAMSRHYWAERTRDGFYKGIALAKAALSRNPDYAPAHAALARAYATRASYAHYPPSTEIALARQHAAQALRLDATLNEAHQAMGFILLYFEWNFDAARAAFETSLRLDPDNATTHQWLTLWHLAQDRDQEAYDLAAHAVALDPSSIVIEGHATWIALMMGRLDEAVRRAEAAVQRDRKAWRSYFSLALALAAVGRVREARDAAEISNALNDQLPIIGVLAHQVARCGDVARARELLADAAAMTPYVSPYWEAYACMGMGDHDAALAALERSVDDHEWFVLFLKHEPAFRDLRHTPRFDALRRRIGLP